METTKRNLTLVHDNTGVEVEMMKELAVCAYANMRLVDMSSDFSIETKFHAKDVYNARFMEVVRCIGFFVEETECEVEQFIINECNERFHF